MESEPVGVECGYPVDSELDMLGAFHVIIGNGLGHVVEDARPFNVSHMVGDGRVDVGDVRVVGCGRVCGDGECSTIGVYECWFVCHV